MANSMDSRRQHAASKVATPRIGHHGPAESDGGLSKAIGARLRITFAAPDMEVLEGTLFAVCTLTNLVAINTAPVPPNPASSLLNQPGHYHVVSTAQIQSVQVLAQSRDAGGADGSPAAASDAVPAGQFRADLSFLDAREKAALQRARDMDAARKRGVSEEGQEIFDALARTLPTRWHDVSIVVNDAVIISKPYNVEDCSAPKDQQNALKWVKKVLEHERKKLAERAKKPPVTSPTPPRRGG